MILPVVAYGHPVLRKVCEDVSPETPGLQELIRDMWETMYHTNGVGIAAPQVNRALRIFVIDTVQIVENFDYQDKIDYAGEQPVKQVFLNARKLETGGEPWPYNEGCLSIPKVREDILRPETVRIAYMNERFEPQERVFDGITARVILHEYDHIEGKLFIDYLPPLKKRLLKKKLDDISVGKVRMDYKMLYSK